MLSFANSRFARDSRAAWENFPGPVRPPHPRAGPNEGQRAYHYLLARRRKAWVGWLIGRDPQWRKKYSNRKLNRSGPDSLIWVGSRLRQIGTFRLSRKDSTRLRHRGCRGWCQKVGRQLSIINWSLNICQITRRLTIQKIKSTNFTTIYNVSVLCNLFSKAEMCQFGASGNHRIWDCRELTG